MDNVFVMLVVVVAGLAILAYVVYTFPFYALAVLLLLALGVGISAKRRWRHEEKRGWRVRCVGEGAWSYEEKKDGLWTGVKFEELGDYRESPHVIGLPPVEKWHALPSWLAGRRDEVIARLRDSLPPPRYEFKEG